MNYKKIISSRKMRITILNMLGWIPDKTMVKIQYRIQMGRKLNLENPKRFSEKLQWYKIYYRNPIMGKCVDKYEVREYVRSKGLEKYLIGNIGIWNDPDEICFDDFPEKFVLKTTNGSHNNIICTNKKDFSEIDSKKQLKLWLKQNKKNVGREWAYDVVKPRIIGEEYLEKDSNGELADYRFTCLNGEIAYLCVTVDSFENETTREIFYNEKFEPLNISEPGCEMLNPDERQKPDNYDEMVRIVKILSADFPQVRVDLLNVDGRIYFGELTFYNSSGYIAFEPDSFDYSLGEKFILPSKMR